MTDKIVVVTGASSGFGKLTALELARRGHRVVAMMRDVDGRNSEVRSELVEAAKTEGAIPEVLEMDVVSDASVTRPAMTMSAPASSAAAIPQPPR